MKSLILGLVLAGSASAFAGPSVDIMSVNKGSGFVPQEMAYSVKCEITSSGVYTETRRGGEVGNTTTSYEPVAFTAKVPDVETATRLITDAATSKSLIETVGPTDGPSSTYIGNISGAVVDQKVKLYIDYSQVRYTNPAAGVDALVEFGDANCQVPARKAGSL